MKLLLFAGAGTSIELRVPGMRRMAEEFLEHSKQWDVEPDLVQTILGQSFDIEKLIEALDHICTARQSLGLIGQDSPSLERIDKIRAEVEWFVQHVAERVVAGDARLMWGSVLRAASSVDLTLVTTNYDRAIELAANAERVKIDDGFDSFGEGEATTWLGFQRDSGTIPLAKLHGSTDWYSDGRTGTPIKLRHPMPLFGRAALRLASGRELGSALVLPSREKLLTHDPYPRLSQAFLNAADDCDFAIFVGSSLRDDHILRAAATTAQRVPVFVVDPDPSTICSEHAVPIRQYASTFLIATLPNALIAADPIEALRAAATKLGCDQGSLVWVRQALDTTALTDVRCRALEELDELGAPLDPFLLRTLLSDPDHRVARYSLGLISLSGARDDLINEALTATHAQHPTFCEDVKLLREMQA